MENIARGEFTVSQKGKTMLNYHGYLYVRNKKFQSGDSVVILWECERRKDLRCPVYMRTNEDGVIIKDATTAHLHDEQWLNFMGMRAS